MRVLPLLSVLLLAGCPASVLSEYEAAKTEALANPGKVSANWQPDIVVNLSQKTVNRAVRKLLEEHATLSEKLSIAGATLEPDFSIDTLALSSSDRCKDCLEVAIGLSGDLDWRLPVLGKGRVPIDASGTFDVVVEVTKLGNQWTATLQPRDLRKLAVRVGGKNAKLKGLAEGPIKKWVDNKLIKKIPKQTLGTFGSKQMPLRAVKVMKADKGLRLGLLSASPSPTPVTLASAKLKSGWRVDIAQDTLTDLARAEAFRKGVLAYDVVAEPTRLEITDDGFTMDLRLWRIKGRGWWRTYSVTGDVRVNPETNKIKLKATDVQELDKSPGAGFVDPLAALAKGIILKNMEDAIKFSLPLAQQTNIGGLPTSIEVSKIGGEGATLSITGSLAVGARPKKGNGKGSKGAKSKGSKGKRGKSRGRGSKGKGGKAKGRGRR